LSSKTSVITQASTFQPQGGVVKTARDGWTRKFKGTERGGAHIHTHPSLARAIVVNHNGVSYAGAEFRDLESAKIHALSTMAGGADTVTSATG
jgi:hypothetical protein